MDHFEKNNNHCETKNEYMNKRQAAKQVWKLTREFNHCDLNREKIRVSLISYCFVLSEHIEWRLIKHIFLSKF